MNEQDPQRTPSLWFPSLLLALAALGFHQLLWHSGAPYPFTRDDNLNYFLPLIHSHTQMSLHLDIPRMIWGLGAGWDPFNGGQAGVLYPLFHLSQLLSMLLASPHALLEISMVLHQILLGILVLLWAPGKQTHRFLLALALMFLPGPFLLGMNWHNYGIAHLWWIAVLLLVHQQVRLGQFFERLSQKFTLAALVLFFFISAHPQMFIWGVLFWAFAFLLLAPRERWGSLFFLLGLCLLPTVPSMLYLREIALQSSTLTARLNNPTQVMDLAQPLHVPLLGSVVGNLLSGLRMNFWDVNAIEMQGPGLYFQPMLWACLVISVVKRRWLLLTLVLLTLLLLGNETFSWTSVFMQGPFKGFHWTFKLVIFTAPLFMLLAFFELQPTQSRGFTWALCAVALVSMAVCFQGRHFDLMSETQDKHDLGAHRILAAADACLEQANIPKQSRLAFVGDYQRRQPQPAAIVPMVGNAMILLERNALHLYEPMDTNETALGRLSLSGRYGYKIKSKDFKVNQNKHLQAFRYLGVTHLFTRDGQLFEPETRTSCDTDDGHRIYFQALNSPRRGTYPHAANTSLTATRNGLLASTTITDTAPVLNTIHPVTWSKTETGWRGYPNPINPLWAASIALLLLLVSLIFWRSK